MRIIVLLILALLLLLALLILLLLLLLFLILSLKIFPVWRISKKDCLMSEVEIDNNLQKSVYSQPSCVVTSISRHACR